MEKVETFQNAIKSAWNKIPKDFRAPVATTAVMVGAGAAVPLAGKVMEGARSLLGTHDPAFHSILKMHPDLEKNKDLAHKYYKSIRHFSPHYANEPMAAGALIKNMIAKFHEDIGGTPYPVVQSLIATNKKIEQPIMGEVFTKAVEQGVRSYEDSGSNEGKVKDLEKDLKREKASNKLRGMSEKFKNQAMELKHVQMLGTKENLIKAQAEKIINQQNQLNALRRK
jgi:hypothetical protein